MAAKGHSIPPLTGPVLMFVGGMFMAFHPTLISGFRLMQADHLDSSLNNYLLEHSWLWLTSATGTVRFWDPAIGYPTPNVLAYSDLMVSFGPPYWIWRAMHFSPQHSLQLWMLTVSAANYWVWYLFLRHAFAFERKASGVGAFLFAFGSSRINQLGHQQLLPQFFVVGVVWGLVVMFRRSGNGLEDRKARGRAILICCLCLAAQFYGGFYLGYFLLLILGATAGVALVMTAHRARLLYFLKENRYRLGVALLLSAVALAPAIQHWFSALQAVGKRPAWAAEGMLLQPQSFLFMGTENWFYGWMIQLPWFRSLPMRHEHAVGLGLVTSVVVGWVVWRQWGNPIVRLTTISAGILVVLLVRLRVPIEFELWPAVYHAIPGMSAIRAVCRIGLFLWVPVSIAVAWFVHRGGLGRTWLVNLIALVCCLEQAVTTPALDVDREVARVDAIAREVVLHADAFLLVAVTPELSSGMVDVLAMLAQQRTGVPTVNLYSGNVPRNWPFTHSASPYPVERSMYTNALVQWLDKHGMSDKTVQLVVQKVEH